MTPTQTNEFVPLVAAAASAGGQEFKITVIPQKEESQQFQSVDKRPSAIFKKNCEPQLTVQRDGGRITSIRIECNCGQVIDVACTYEEPPKS